MKTPEPGTFKYGSICCGLAWGKPVAVIARITGTTVAIVRRVEKTRNANLAKTLVSTKSKR